MRADERFAVTVSCTLASPALLHAQTDPASGTRDTTTVTDRDNFGNWGWLGLLKSGGLKCNRRPASIAIS